MRNFIVTWYELININYATTQLTTSNLNNKIHIIFGPTASGKTEFAVDLGKKLGNAEIINADSMQIYKEIPIITNQPTEAEKQDIPHYLFGISSILEHSDVAKWLDIAVPKIKEIQAKDKNVILSGGTGLYLKSITEGVSDIPNIPAEIKNNIANNLEKHGLGFLYEKLKNKSIADAEKIKPNDSQRIIRALSVLEHTGVSIHEWNKKPNKIFFPPEDFKIYFLNKNREEIYNKINLRFTKMVENGLLEEAEKANILFSTITNNLSSITLPAYKAHGLREIISYIKGEISKEEAIAQAQQATRNYAKRQFTWWRGWVKNNKNLEFEEVA